MGKKRSFRRLLSSDDDLPPKPSTSQPSYLINSVLQKMLSSTANFPATRASSSHSQASNLSTSLMPLYKQADLELNQGLKGKSQVVSERALQNDPTGKKLDEELHSLFPQLFAYLDSQPKAINHRYDSSKQDPCYKYLPPYHLCVKSHSEVAIASGADFPTGEIIYEKVKAGKRPSHDDSEILFITHNRIPNLVLEQWKYPMIKATGK
ncbi:hypothetical protein BKA82DRAFT_26532 [Pisolithus tinctorius]|uniref:Uncharacterized protein n=1 Tax=Pisolithus tinctorius Marx 270 TaxID=870435 RepID=A0A0C3NSR9_PISTI|nr:hypothetical protein BKA82DRAFT_26532 [Pisolithus tinctorius]KIO03920.1 hypothetical protein M404DRAFT_26532 [Pisolithus tinctorius Marx 270]